MNDYGALGIPLHLEVYMMELIPCVNMMRPRETKQRECQDNAGER